MLFLISVCRLPLAQGLRAGCAFLDFNAERNSLETYLTEKGERK